MKIIQGAYVRDILEQPRAIAETAARLAIDGRLEAVAARLRQGEFRRLLLTGMGSSLYALHPLQIELAAAGLAPMLVETAELLHSLPRLLEGALVVAVSQSGRSAEIVRLVEQRREGTGVIGVTNTPESPLGTQSDAVVTTDAGEEFSVSCKTYVATLAALEGLGAALMQRDWRAGRERAECAARAAAQYLAHWRDHVGQLADVLDRAQMKQLFLVGRGASLGAVLTGGLILKESTHMAAEGMSAAAFRHGPLEMAGPGTVVMVFSGDGRVREMTQRLANDIERVGGTVMAVGADAPVPALALPEAPASVLPMLEILPVEMLTLALAARAEFEAGLFSHATKVTTVE